MMTNQSGKRPKLPCLCGGKIAIVDCRTREDGLVYRRHLCYQCKNRYSTVEVELETFRRMESELKDYQTLMMKLDALRQSYPEPQGASRQGSRAES